MIEVAWGLLVASLVVLGWTYVGYPAALAVHARLAPRPPARMTWRPSVTVCIAVNNGLAHLDAKLDGLFSHDYPAELLDVIVVCDGSTDGTRERLRQRVEPRLRVIEGAGRRGKTACLADAIRVATGEVLVFTDVRQTLAKGSLRALCDALGGGELAAASGLLRFVDPSGYARSVDAYWRYETAIRRMEGLTGSVVGVTGALYAVRRGDMPEPPPGLVLDDVWVPMAIAAEGGRIGLVEDAIAFDQPSDNARAESRRKRRTLAGNWQLIARWPGLLLPWRHPLAWRFWSHKVLRLIAPVFLLLALGANLALWGASQAADAFLVGQGLAYALGLLGLLLPVSRGVLPVRLTSAFLEMNLYAVLAFIDVLRGGDTHLWRASPSPQAEEQSTP